MKLDFENLLAREAKRRRAAAVQDSGAFTLASAIREASWTAPVLWRFCLALILGLFVFSQPASATDTTADFASANKLYAEGKFADAATAYDAILKTGAQSPALLFNAGNAEFKAGHLGKAIAAYRRAELLTPRDAELRANLAFVRNQVQGATLRESRWQNWVGSLTLNEGALLTAGFFWALFLLMAAKQIVVARASRPCDAGQKLTGKMPAPLPLRRAIFVCAMLTLSSGAILGLQATNHFSSSVAVVTDAEATARSGPFDDAQTAFSARDGAELKVLDRHDDWVQVANNAGRIGWLNVKQAAVLPGA